jgi:hypothetical protein
LRPTVFASASTSFCFVTKLREKSTCFTSDIERRTVTPFQRRDFALETLRRIHDHDVALVFQIELRERVHDSAYRLLLTAY